MLVMDDDKTLGRWTRQPTLPEPWRAMALKAGGVDKLAEAFSVTPMTIWRWGKGVRPRSAIVVKAVNDWARRRGIDEPWVEHSSSQAAGLADTLTEGIRKGLKR